MKGDDKRRGNLVSNSERTPKKRREIAKLGGVASGVARKARRTMRETLISLLQMPMKNGGLSAAPQSVEGFKTANVSLHERIMLSMAARAAKGDVRAATFIRDTIGEMPVQEVKVEQTPFANFTDEQLLKIANGET